MVDVRWVRGVTVKPGRLGATALIALATACRAAPEARAVGVSVLPATGRVAAGGRIAFHAGVDAGWSAVAWWIREPSGCGVVTQEGVWTAPPRVPSPPTCHVMATSFDGARTVAASMEVTASGEGESPAPDPRPSFPLRVSADGRYLEDHDGRPFRIQADAAWFMSTNATPDQVEAYLALRQAQGFDAFYLMAMVHPGAYRDVPHAPANAAGEAPFTVPGRFSAPNEGYWRWIDFIVDRAAARGLAVMLAYSYLGYQGGDQGWYREVLDQPGPEACE